MANVLNMSPSSERIEELWLAWGLNAEKWSHAFGGNTVTQKTQELIR